MPETAPVALLSARNGRRIVCPAPARAAAAGSAIGESPAPNNCRAGWQA